MCRFRFARANAALLLALVALVASGCSGTRSEPSASTSALSAAPKSAMPRDDLGRDLKLSAPAKRVIVIGPGAVETIFALGAGSVIVGRDSAADFPAQIKEVPIVADFRGPFIEACVAARPDLILAQGETWSRERVENWQKKIGVPVAALTPTTVEAVQEDADKIAAWLGLKEKNLRLPSSLSYRASSAPILTAFVEIQRSPLWTAGRGTLVSNVVERSGIENVARDVDGYKAFSKESLLSRKPDFYIVSGQPRDKARILAQLKADPILGSLACVVRGQVLVVPGDWLLRPGPRLANGIRALQQAQKQLLNAEPKPRPSPST